MNYRDLPEAEKIPLRVKMATRLYLDMLLIDGIPAHVVESAQHRLAASEQYSGAAGAKRALDIQRLPPRQMKRAYQRVVAETAGYQRTEEDRQAAKNLQKVLG